MSREHLIKEARAHLMGLELHEILDLVQEVLLEKPATKSFVWTGLEKTFKTLDEEDWLLGTRTQRFAGGAENKSNSPRGGKDDSNDAHASGGSAEE